MIPATTSECKWGSAGRGQQGLTRAVRSKCIHLIDTFTYRNHVCIVSELLGQSVFDFLKDNEFHPFPCKDIWSFAKQLLRSVACECEAGSWPLISLTHPPPLCLVLHRLGLVHTDLKPENILLVSNEHTVVPLTKRANSRKKRALKDSEIRLIDFGSATFNDEYHSQVVSTRHYRAPEIILRESGWMGGCAVSSRRLTGSGVAQRWDGPFPVMHGQSAASSSSSTRARRSFKPTTILSISP